MHLWFETVPSLRDWQSDSTFHKRLSLVERSLDRNSLLLLPQRKCSYGVVIECNVAEVESVASIALVRDHAISLRKLVAEAIGLLKRNRCVTVDWLVTNHVVETIAFSAEMHF